MARLQCRACGLDQAIEWDGDLRCPNCGSTDVRVAIAVEEMPEELVERLRRSTAEDDGGTIRDGN